MLVSGTSLYNELMKPCLPGAAERRRWARIDLQVQRAAIGSLKSLPSRDYALCLRSEASQANHVSDAWVPPA